MTPPRLSDRSPHLLRFAVFCRVRPSSGRLNPNLVQAGDVQAGEKIGRVTVFPMVPDLRDSSSPNPPESRRVPRARARQAARVAQVLSPMTMQFWMSRPDARRRAKIGGARFCALYFVSGYPRGAMTDSQRVEGPLHVRSLTAGPDGKRNRSLRESRRKVGRAG
jgi:hypothetical protein